MPQKAPRLAAFLATLGHIQFPCAVLLESCRARDVPEPGWAMGWAEAQIGPATDSKVPAFHRHDERGFGRRLPSGDPQGTAAPAPDPDPGGRRTLAATPKFPAFLTN